MTNATDTLSALTRLEAAALAGDTEAATRYAVESRRSGLTPALDRWARLLEAKMDEHQAASVAAGYPGLAASGYQVKHKMEMEKGRKFIRVWAAETTTQPGEEDRSRRHAYAFIEIATGNILKPGTWKAPEPAKIIRGNVYAADCLAGCGPHGVAYVAGGGNIGWSKADPIAATPLPAEATE